MIPLLALATFGLGIQITEPLPTISVRTSGMERQVGLFNCYLDRGRARVYLEFPPPQGSRGVSAELLLVDSLRTGLGSNDIGLDRGLLGPTRLIEVRRVGEQVLVEAQNLRYRADSPFPAERQAVRESFAPSVLWGTRVAAANPDGTFLVDWTPMVTRDANDVAGRLRSQGSYRLDASRTVFEPDEFHVFPDNIAMEATLTFTTDGPPGALVGSVSALASTVTLVQHQSLVRLPPPGYRPRAFDPRMGFFSVRFADYAAPLERPLERAWILRHRLEKTDPTAERSTVHKPIVFYVDRGAPEPIRTALLEGARWWARAFEEAGFIDAYRVELLPEDAHPLDVRYNVIQWVHRSTRGWSYGRSIADPRTGEILKGHVSLGSLRVRHDRLLFEGLLGTEKTGSDELDDPIRLALERIKQLSAHEVGHTLGLAHNFAASSYNRASVMDYPAPLIGVLPDGSFDVARAYRPGVGEWDVHAIRWGYSQVPPEQEASHLDAIVRDGLTRGYIFLSDADARDLSTAHPAASLWDHGSDPVAALQEAYLVRELALNRFGERNIAPGQPLAFLEEVLAPIYLWHRYQVEATAKVLGGLEYTFALRGDGQVPTRPVSPDRQVAALNMLLRGLEPEFLDIPEPVLRLLAPRPYGSLRNREQFPSHTLPAFDPLAAATVAADLIASAILNPERSARLVEFHRRDRRMPSLESTLSAVIERTFPAPPTNEIGRTVQQVVVVRLVDLAADAPSPAVRSAAEAALRRLTTEQLAGLRGDATALAHQRRLAEEIKRFLERPHDRSVRPRIPNPPPGAPIGIIGATDYACCSG